MTNKSSPPHESCKGNRAKNSNIYELENQIHGFKSQVAQNFMDQQKDK
jgi:hypothetical protein